MLRQKLSLGSMSERPESCWSWKFLRCCSFVETNCLQGEGKRFFHRLDLVQWRMECLLGKGSWCRHRYNSIPVQFVLVCCGVFLFGWAFGGLVGLVCFFYPNHPSHFKIECKLSFHILHQWQNCFYRNWFPQKINIKKLKPNTGYEIKYGSTNAISLLLFSLMGGNPHRTFISVAPI